MNAINFKTISISDLAALVHTKFNEHSMKTVLVGGACVAIYSSNRYLSYDLDFVTYETRGKIKEFLYFRGFFSSSFYRIFQHSPPIKQLGNFLSPFCDPFFQVMLKQVLNSRAVCLPPLSFA